MNGTIGRSNYEYEKPYILGNNIKDMADRKMKNFDDREDGNDPGVCGNFSGYSMLAVAGGILMCIGILVYAFLTA